MHDRNQISVEVMQSGVLLIDSIIVIAGVGMARAGIKTKKLISCLWKPPGTFFGNDCLKCNSPLALTSNSLSWHSSLFDRSISIFVGLKVHF